MRVIIVDDERHSIDLLCYFLKKHEVEIVATYIDPILALNNTVIDKPDILFVDIEMPELNGLQLAQEIKSRLPDVIIVFITAFAGYAIESFQVHPMDYLLKPVTARQINKMMDSIMRQFMLLTLEREKGSNNRIIQMKCFGKFEVLSSGNEAMKFPTTKTKELMTYLICKANKAIYRDEIMSLLFTGKEGLDRNNFYVTVSRLKTALSSYGIDETLFKFNKDFEVFIKKGICDLYDLTVFIRSNTRITEENLLEAERLIGMYDGEVFSNIDTDWTNEISEWVEIQMEETMLLMAEYYKEKAVDKYESILKKLLNINALSSRGYEELLGFYMESDKKEKYKALFHRYTKVMKNDLNLDIDKRFIKYMDLQIQGELIG
ncbi:MAG: hypothetical protein K0R05_1322 [Anaerocolumna sp.]|nr:hypothetical protein [Anaerocolumna sp.]